MIKRFWSDRPVLANWLVLAVGMVLILFISARHVGFTPSQWAALVETTICAGRPVCVVISWE
ncbi:MAG: hypothetical protein R2854_25995 [Caldilineaceae bacterium]